MCQGKRSGQLGTGALEKCPPLIKHSSFLLGNNSGCFLLKSPFLVSHISLEDLLGSLLLGLSHTLRVVCVPSLCFKCPDKCPVLYFLENWSPAFDPCFCSCWWHHFPSAFHCVSLALSVASAHSHGMHHSNPLCDDGLSEHWEFFFFSGAPCWNGSFK